MIVVTHDAYVLIDGVDLTDHCVQATVSYGLKLREVTRLGDTHRRFRPEMLDPSINAEFYNDLSTGSVESTLRGLLGQEGFPVEIRKHAAEVASDNPAFFMQSMIDGEIAVLDEVPGDISRVKVRFVPCNPTAAAGSTTGFEVITTPFFLRLEDDTGYITLEDGSKIEVT